MRIKRVLAIVLVGSIVISGCTAKKEPPPADSTPSEAVADTKNIDGGKPWINSNLKENVINVGHLSEKDDYYIAVNYDWIMEHDIPEGSPSYSGASVLRSEIEEKAIAAMEDDTLTGVDARLVSLMYHSFLDWDSRNENGLAPLEAIVKDIEALADIDAVSEYTCSSERPELVKTVVKIKNSKDLLESTKYVTAVEFNDLLLGDSSEYSERSPVGQLQDDENRKLFSSLMVRMGYSQEESDKIYDASMEYEKQLAESIYSYSDYSQSDIYSKVLNYYEPDEMYALTSEFPMKEFIKGRGYDNAKQFYSAEPEALKKISGMYTQDNIEGIKGYMIVHTVIASAEYLDRQAFEAAITADNNINGATGILSDKHYAYTAVRSALPDSIGKMYIQKYDPSETKKTLTQICKDIVAKYREMLKEEEWLSDETKQLAIEKLDAMKINVIEPGEYIDYGDLKLDNLSYFDIQKAIKDYEHELDLRNTNGTVNKNLWPASTLETEAFYSPTNNSINVMLGILGDDFYRDDMSKEELYASIGTIIGHEISHAFDPSGAHFDKNGDMKDWWTEEDLAAFEERTAKLIDFYAGITVFGDVNVIGSNVKDEAVADIAGMKVMLSLAEKEEDFNYQEFFESYAKIWKLILTYEYSYSLVLGNPHPLNYLRVNTVVQQFDEFTETYNLEDGDGMYLAPENRVSVW